MFKNKIFHFPILVLILLFLLFNSFGNTNVLKYTDEELREIIDKNKSFVNNEYMDDLNYKDILPILVHFDQIKDAKIRGDAAFVLAHYYLTLRDNRKAVQYFEIATNNYLENNNPGLYLNALKDLCNAYRIFEMSDRVEGKLLFGIEYAKKHDVGFYVLDPIMELSIHYSYSVQQFDKAIYYGHMFLDSLAKFEKQKIVDEDYIYNRTIDAAIVKLELGHSYAEIREYKKADAYLMEAAHFFTANNDLEKLTRLYRYYLTSLIRQNKNPQMNRVLDSLKKYDALHRKRLFKAINLRPQYLSEIDSLKTKGLINAVLISSLRKERYYLLAVTGVIVILALFVIWHIRQSKIKQVQINKLLIRDNEISQKLHRDKTKYFAIISHELRTPIYTLTGLTRLLKKPEHYLKENINAIIHASDHLLQLVNNILSHNHLEDSESIKLDEDKFYLTEVFEKARQGIAYFAGQNRNTMVFKNSLRGKHAVIGDKKKLIQIVINLLTNAIRFSKTGGSITLKLSLLETHSDTNLYHFSVVDAGIGMSQRQIDQINNYNGSPSLSHLTHSENEVGLGIGLYVVSRFLKAMGSEINIKSIENEGTVFSFDIALNTVKNHTINPSIDDRNITVMVVDDFKMNLIVTKKILTGLGFNAITVIDPENVFALLEQGDIGVILMDLNMPDLNGYELSRKIREAGFAIPIIAHTAMSYEDIDHARLAALGIHSILTKPYPEQELKSKIYACV